MNPQSGHCVLLTGVTGFLGKVVLEQLACHLQCRRVIVLIRDKKETDGKTRFRDSVFSSPCFSLLSPAWGDLVEVVSGDLTASDLCLEPATYERLRGEVTHIIHCAGCVKFDLPVAEAAVANVSTVLNLLEFAQRCTSVQHIVSTSTAYVTLHRSGPIYETLVPLPRPADELYQDMLAGRVPKQEILKQSGHPNTYTLSKCIAEHLLVARRGFLPLTIVRPSIISASWRRPFPGWIDSLSAFAGFLAAYGNGLLRVVDADPRTILDVIPVDEVASRLVSAAFDEQSSVDGEMRILHATASLLNGLCIDLVFSQTRSYFKRNQVDSFRSPYVQYLGSRGIFFHLYDLYQRIPLFMASIFCAIRQDQRMSRKLNYLRDGISRLNREYPYFTHNSFNFRPSTHLPDEFQPEMYLEVVLNGVCTHLLSGGLKCKGVKTTTSKLVRSGSTASFCLSVPTMWILTIAFACIVISFSTASVWRITASQ